MRYGRLLRLIAMGSITLAFFWAGTQEAQACYGYCTLTVYNYTYGSLDVWVDGSYRGRLQPGGRRVIRGLDPGWHTVWVWGNRGRARRRFYVDAWHRHRYEVFD